MRIDSSLLHLIDPFSIAGSRFMFLVNSGSSSSSTEAVNNSVNLNSIKPLINIMKFSLLNFNGYYWPKAVFNYCPSSSATLVTEWPRVLEAFVLSLMFKEYY